MFYQHKCIHKTWNQQGTKAPPTHHCKRISTTTYFARTRSNHYNPLYWCFEFLILFELQANIYFFPQRQNNEQSCFWTRNGTQLAVKGYVAVSNVGRPLFMVSEECLSIPVLPSLFEPLFHVHMSCLDIEDKAILPMPL